MRLGEEESMAKAMVGAGKANTQGERTAAPIKWTPRLGAVVGDRGVVFRVWVPMAGKVELILEGGANGARALHPEGNGFFTAFLDDVKPGALYRFRVDGQGPFPDPASRRQPLGVHGPSEIVDPSGFLWTDKDWPGVALGDVVFYELHVGTFTPAGTFAGVREKLSGLRELGITVVELMPVADFPGERNWGYDGVSPFAPARCYGSPDDLRALVDCAHGTGLAVWLDVVYNHLGPDGNYLGAFSPFIYSERHHTPWGKAINLDGPHSGPVRAFFIENALHWLHEYHLDGLRLDATHAICDESPRPFLAELAASVHALPEPRRMIVAEDNRNLAALVRRENENGIGLDGVWADDFHHQVRRRLAGDREGYFADYSGQAADVAETVERAFFFRGQMLPTGNRPRGTDPTGVPAERFVFCIQNHDQVGNRALGERLHHQIDPAAYRAAVALLLLSPETPLLFMGQEWSTSSPFLYFTDHEPGLGQKVTAGRHEEFKAFAAISSPEAQVLIPDPQDQATFASSRLPWDERAREPHASTLRLHQALLDLRRRVVRAGQREVRATALGTDGLLLRYPGWMVMVQLEGAGTLDLSRHADDQSWNVTFHTENPDFAHDSQPPRVDWVGRRLTVVFCRPGALVLSQSAIGDRP
jgi:maltooligosyltrehalose trehalohydrolase